MPGQSEPILTLGELFPDGGAIDRLCEDRLILRDQKGEEIGVSLRYNGKTYEPAALPSDLKELLRLPDRTEDFGSIEDLITKLSERIATYVSPDETTELLLASFVLSSWVVESLPVAPVLNLWGPAGTENSLLDLLSCLCRRSLRLTEPSVRELSNLPAGLCPTLILKRPSQRALSQLLSAATEPEFNILRAGRFIHLQCAIVAYTEDSLPGAALRIPLPQAAGRYRRIAKAEAQQLADEFQPRLLRYRLSRHARVTKSCFDYSSFTPETRALARLLGASVEGEPGIQADIVRALESVDERTKVEQSQSPTAVVLEALLVLCHEKKQASYVFEITELANGILLGRHDTLELSPKAVGGIMRSKIGLCPERSGPGYELSFTGDTQRSIHRLANGHGVLSRPQPEGDCTFCDEIREANRGAAEEIAASRMIGF
ncbi:MAG: hypothetical protein WB384_23405 [Candidatus Sulfotelmatobacter sp.]